METTKVPIKTEYGWHVVQLTGTTPFVAPGFDQIKENIRRALQARLTDERIAGLKSKAQIVLLNPAGATDSAAASRASGN